MGARRRFASTARFLADQAGIVTVQMVMFSILLFGGIGLMMDFGRAYSAHSQMQGYIDQVALAAARQLDGKDDAIARATAAAKAVAKGSSFVDGSGGFEVEDLVFMTDAPTDGNGDFDLALAATYATTNDAKAQYVFAVAKTRSVALKLLRFGVEDDSGLEKVDLSASAVAMSKTVACGGMSTLVMCNPFENRTDTSWEEEMEASRGWRMWLTAEVSTQEPLSLKPSNYSGGQNQIRLGLLKMPDTLMEMRNAVCSDTDLLPGYMTMGTEYSLEDLKDICMLATVETGLACVNDEVAFKRADPGTITTGLGAAFDLWDGPLDDILSQPDINISAWGDEVLGATMRSELFAPDRMTGLGRMTRADFQIYMDDVKAEMDANPAFAFWRTLPPTHPMYARSPYKAIADKKAAYAPSPSIPEWSRLNHVFVASERDDWGPYAPESCLEQSSGVPNCTGPYPAIHADTPGNNDLQAYVGEVYMPYAMQYYVDYPENRELDDGQEPDTASYDNWWEAPSERVSSEFIAGDRETYYSLWSEVERVNDDLRSEYATNGHTGGAAAGEAQTPGGYGIYGLQMAPKHYTAAYGDGAVGMTERRKQRVSVVNCEAAQSYASVTGNTDGQFTGTYIGEVVDVVDLFLLSAPQVNRCAAGTAPTADPEGNLHCDNRDVELVNLDVEVVDSATMNPTNFDARFYAVLIH